jgi:catalase
MSSKKPSSNKSQMAGTDTLDRGNTNVKLESLERLPR